MSLIYTWPELDAHILDSLLEKPYLDNQYSFLFIGSDCLLVVMMSA